MRKGCTLECSLTQRRIDDNDLHPRQRLDWRCFDANTPRFCRHDHSERCVRDTSPNRTTRPLFVWTAEKTRKGARHPLAKRSIAPSSPNTNVSHVHIWGMSRGVMTYLYSFGTKSQKKKKKRISLPCTYPSARQQKQKNALRQKASMKYTRVYLKHPEHASVPPAALPKGTQRSVFPGPTPSTQRIADSATHSGSKQTIGQSENPSCSHHIFFLL